MTNKLNDLAYFGIAYFKTLNEAKDFAMDIYYNETLGQVDLDITKTKNGYAVEIR